MASAFSNPREYAPYQEQYNKELLAKAMMYKQGKYDLNKQKINQTIQNLTGLDIARDVDQEYLNNKLQGVLNVINQYGMGDLSLDDRTDYLSSYIANVADDNVMNAYMGTMSMRNIQKEASQAKKDGKYSDLNYQYSMRDAMKWMENPEVGAEFVGNKSYVPYTDLNLKFMNQLKNIEPQAYSKLSPTGEATYYKQSGKKIEESTLKAAFSLMLDGDLEAAQQLQVNAWNEFRNLSDQEFFIANQDYFNNMSKQYDDTILKLQREIANKQPSDLEVQRLNALLKHTQDNKELYISANINKIRPQLEVAYYRNKLVDNYAKTFAITSVEDVGIVTDQERLEKIKNGNGVLDKLLNAKYVLKNDAYAAALLDNNRDILASINPKYKYATIESISATGAQSDLTIAPGQIPKRPIQMLNDLEVGLASEQVALNNSIEVYYQDVPNDKRALYFNEDGTPKYDEMVKNLLSDNPRITGPELTNIRNQIEELDGKLLILDKVKEGTYTAPINDAKTWINEVLAYGSEGAEIELDKTNKVVFKDGQLKLITSGYTATDNTRSLAGSALVQNYSEKSINEQELNDLIKTFTLREASVGQPSTHIKFKMPKGSQVSLGSYNTDEINKTLTAQLEERYAPALTTGARLSITGDMDADVSTVFKDFIEQATAKGMVENLSIFADTENVKQAIDNYLSGKKNSQGLKTGLLLDYNPIVKTVTLTGGEEPVVLSLADFKPSSSLFQLFNDFQGTVDTKVKYNAMEQVELSKITDPNGGSATKNLGTISINFEGNNKITITPQIVTVITSKGTKAFKVKMEKKYLEGDQLLGTEELEFNDINSLLKQNVVPKSFGTLLEANTFVDNMVNNQYNITQLLKPAQ